MLHRSIRTILYTQLLVFLYKFLRFYCNKKRLKIQPFTESFLFMISKMCSFHSIFISILSSKNQSCSLHKLNLIYEFNTILPWDLLNRVSWESVGGLKNWKVEIVGTKASHTSMSGLIISLNNKMKSKKHPSLCKCKWGMFFQ